MNKRERRRLKREVNHGPDRAILSWTPELAKLECGHEIHNPPQSQTVHMRTPKFYRCMQCLYAEVKAWDNGTKKPTDPEWYRVDPVTGEPISNE